jgi:hypothetical protein
VYVRAGPKIFSLTWNHNGMAVSFQEWSNFGSLTADVTGARNEGIDRSGAGSMLMILLDHIPEQGLTWMGSRGCCRENRVNGLKKDPPLANGHLLSMDDSAKRRFSVPAGMVNQGTLLSEEMTPDCSPAGTGRSLEGCRGSPRPDNSENFLILVTDATYRYRDRFGYGRNRSRSVVVPQFANSKLCSSSSRRLTSGERGLEVNEKGGQAFPLAQFDITGGAPGLSPPSSRTSSCGCPWSVFQGWVACADCQTPPATPNLGARGSEQNPWFGRQVRNFLSDRVMRRNVDPP